MDCADLIRIWDSLPRVIRYASVGGAVAFLDLVFFFIFAYLGNFPYLWVNFIGFVLGTMANYFLSIRFVFKRRPGYTTRKELVRVYIISVVGLTVSQISIYIFISILSVPMILSKVMTLVINFFWNYLARARFVFN